MLAFYLSVMETQEDKNRFEQIYIEYKQIMYSVAYSVLNDEMDAEDAVHNTLLKIADNFSKIEYTSIKELKAFVVMVCKNTAIDMYRSNRRRLGKNLYVESDNIPDTDTFDNVDYSSLYSAIKELPKIYKDVLYLYEIMGFSAKEISKQLNISTALVYKRLERAKIRLKEILSKGETYAGK